MSYMTTLFQVVLLFGALGYGAYYMTKKTAPNSSFLSKVKTAIFK